MKIERKSKLELGSIELPDVFILNNMPNIEGIDLKVYLYLMFLNKKQKEFELKDIAKALYITDQELSFSIERLLEEELITKISGGFNIVDLREVEINKSYIPKLENRMSKAQTEVEKRRIAATKAISDSYFQGMMSLTWYTDIAAMFDNYKFSEEVMIALFHYCQERKALNRKYVHAVAEGWYKAGVKTFEQLEEHFESYEKVQKIKQKIVKALNLKRNLTTYEEQYIDIWIKDFNYDFSMIEEALKRTVSKANPTMSYVNGILSNWHKKGYKTKDEIVEEKTFENKTIKKEENKTKYQSYTQRKYDDLDAFYDNV